MEIWLLILVAYLLQRNVNSGHMPTKAADPEAFMNVVSWGFPCLGEVKGDVLAFAFVSSCVLCYFYILKCSMLEHVRTVWGKQYAGRKLNFLIDWMWGWGLPNQIQ